ncbi:chorismate mutase [Govanella unica]|uniref:chorismate mutase n=1 Tax=Govanella unica TaxID=2975056 RepID=A0A9X3TXZ8_9PROT|nr:chorismate mutase [Govania unica]
MTSQTVSRPQAVACETMIDVRREIDRIDRAMVTLIAERENYIQQAGHIKQSRDTVRDEARIQDVLDKVTVTAQATGANPDLVTTVYRTMMEWCIAYEFTVFDAKGE